MTRTDQKRLNKIGKDWTRVDKTGQDWKRLDTTGPDLKILNIEKIEMDFSYRVVHK